MKGVADMEESTQATTLTLPTTEYSPKSSESSVSAHLSEDGRQNLLEAWPPAKPTAPTQRKQ